MSQTERSLQTILANIPTGVEGGTSAEDVRDAIISLYRMNNARDGYTDSAHTLGSPQALSADTEYQYTNNGLAASDSLRVPDDNPYWNTTTNLINSPRQDENWTIRTGFTFDQTGGGTGHYIKIDYVIPNSGSPITISSETVPILKASPVVYLDTFKFFSGPLIVSTGLQINLTPSVAGNLYSKNITVFTG
mgnify:CR=1 FL=1